MTAKHIAKVRRSKTGFQGHKRFRQVCGDKHLHIHTTPLTELRRDSGKSSRSWRRSRRNPNAPHIKGANKMNMSEYSGSAFVKINDLADGPERKTIANVEIGRYGRPVLTFTDRSRLSVNVTNNKVLVRAFGDDDEAWVGQKIELYAGRTRYEDGETDSVLVRPFSPSAATRKPQSDSDDSMSDEIPFN